MQIEDTGGDPRPLTQVAEDELDHPWPQVLPDDKHVLFTVSLREGRLEPRLLSLESGKVVRLNVQGVLARFVQSPRVDGSGFLVYMRSNDLWAVRRDPAAGKTLGDPVLVVPRIQVSELGDPHLAVAASGTLVYEPMRPPSPGRGLSWVDRSGESTPLTSGKGYEFPRLSPDERKVLVAIHTDMASHDIWTVDSRNGAELKVTSGGNYVEPIWSPGGNEIVFAEFWGGNLHTQRLGESKARVLLPRNGRQYPSQWRSGSSLMFMEQLGGQGHDLAELDPSDGTVRKLITTIDNECAGVVSPDGNRMAYVSDETGRPEIYVRRFPQLDGKEPVSRDGGTEPVWSADGGELFFRKGRAVLAVRIPERAGDPIGEPEELFEGEFVPGFMNRPNYDVTRDGKRFVMVEGGWGLTMGRLDVHLHFDEELDAALP
ncbi:MAG: TolB family protein [Planctomycetota bacterium]|jgi:serine/threonine-protein kinase